jgi:serine/threonine protein kinase
VAIDPQPDNILVNRDLTAAKVCDMGSAMTMQELNEHPPGTDLVARLYR